MHRESETRVDRGTLPRYELDGWRSRFGIVAGVTGREADFRLTARPSEPAADRIAQWARLPTSVGGFDGVVVSRQRHGIEIAVHRHPGVPVWLGEGFDGHLAQQPGLLLALTVADCIPVYLAHPASQTVALLHAGWRGTAAGILDHGIEAVCAAGAARPAELIMHCGIGICGACYEVGHEVVSAVAGSTAASSRRVDLRRALVERACAVGIGEVTVSSWCTAHDHDRFHSHRRSGGDGRRMAAYLGLPAG